jgi:hypothetical protein
MAVLPLEIPGLPYRRFSDQIKGLWTVPGICGIRFLVVHGIEFILVVTLVQIRISICERKKAEHLLA